VLKLTEPFLVCIPSPIRVSGEPMEVASAEFDGQVVRVAYHKHPGSSRGWWYAAATHEFLWLPDVRTPEQALDHYLAWWNEEHPDPPLTADQRATARRDAEFVSCGRGVLGYLHPDLMGVRVAGGPHHIYLLSEGGERGALRVPTSLYHGYPLDGFEVLGPAGQPPARGGKAGRTGRCT
jgi:hypothetical protein